MNGAQLAQIEDDCPVIEAIKMSKWCSFFKLKKILPIKKFSKWGHLR